MIFHLLADSNDKQHENLGLLVRQLVWANQEGKLNTILEDVIKATFPGTPVAIQNGQPGATGATGPAVPVGMTGPMG